MAIRWILLLALLFSPPGSASTTAAREAINAALERWLSAWEARNPELAARDYSSSADFTNAFGATRRGRDEIEALLTDVFAMDFVMAGKTHYEPPEIRFVSDQLALVRSTARRSGQQTSDGDELGLRSTTHLRVFEKRDGQWLIISHLISDARSRARPEH